MRFLAKGGFTSTGDFTDNAFGFTGKKWSLSTDYVFFPNLRDTVQAQTCNFNVDHEVGNYMILGLQATPNLRPQCIVTISDLLLLANKLLELS